MSNVTGIADHLCKKESQAENAIVIEMAKRITEQYMACDDPRLFVYALMKVALIWEESAHYGDGWVEFVRDALQEEIIFRLNAGFPRI